MERHAITIVDLVTIGRPTRLRISPDGRFATFVVVRANLESNDYRAELFLGPTQDGERPSRLAELNIPAARDQGLIPAGEVDSLWSPDSEYVAYVKQRGGEVEVWVSDPLARCERLLADSLPNVKLEAWDTERLQLVYSVRREKAVMDTSANPDPAILYDGQRVSTGNAWRKPSALMSEPEYWRVALAGGASERMASEKVVKALPKKAPGYEYPRVNPLWNVSAESTALSPNGEHVAFLTRFVKSETATDPPVFRGMAVSMVPSQSGRPVRHLYRTDGSRLAELDWSSDSRSVLVVGQAPELTQIYRIPLNGDPPRELYTTADGLSDLAWDSARRTFLAVRQSPTVPPEIVHVDWATKRIRTLYRPNANFDEIELPEKPRYLKAISRYGHEFGVRVTLPNDYRPGHRYPLVATTYVSPNEFQIGAVGDEYPIYPYAAAGFVVASLNDFPDMLAPSERGNIDVTVLRQSSPLDALEKVVERLVDEGMVDPKRCGITGLSYGAEIVGSALVHSKVFSAAAAATSTFDPSVYFLLDEIWQKDYLNTRGLPFPDLHDQEALMAWKKISPALNAARIRTPLLLQAPDEEALTVMETYHSLRHAAVPVELYVYPDEGHFKSAPRSKYWVYRRNLDWMRFWLQGYEDPDQAKEVQYMRWRALRGRRGAFRWRGRR